MLTGSKTTFKVRQMLPDIKVRSQRSGYSLIQALVFWSFHLWPLVFLLLSFSHSPRSFSTLVLGSLLQHVASVWMVHAIIALIYDFFRAALTSLSWSRSAVTHPHRPQSRQCHHAGNTDRHSPNWAINVQSCSQVATKNLQSLLRGSSGVFTAQSWSFAGGETSKGCLCFPLWG